MDHTIDIAGGVMTITLRDKLIYSDTAAYGAVIAKIRDASFESCVLDLGKLAHIDSSGLRMVLLTHDACREKVTPLSVSGAKGQVREMLIHCKFDTILRIDG